MKKEHIIIGVLILIIFGIAGFYAYNQIQEQAYQQGVQDAVLLINQNILDSLTQKGYVPFGYTIGNETDNIKLGVMESN